MVDLHVTQHALNQRLVGRGQRIGAAQLALTLGGHLGQDMALVSMLALVTGTGLLEALGSATIYFCFRNFL